jgi:hypothetical protein
VPLYELILCFPDRTESRLANGSWAVGDTVWIEDIAWEVVAKRRSKRATLPVDFVCHLERTATTRRSGRFDGGSTG